MAIGNWWEWQVDGWGVHGHTFLTHDAHLITSRAWVEQVLLSSKDLREVAGKGSVHAFPIPYHFNSSIPNGTNFAMKADSADDGLGGAHIQTFSQSKESSEVIGEGRFGKRLDD